MAAKLIKHLKAVDEAGDILEIKIWELPAPSKDKPHGFKCSLGYLAGGVRVVCYDNAHGKGDHRHYGNTIKAYRFRGIDQLIKDFYRDVRRFKK